MIFVSQIKLLGVNPYVIPPADVLEFIFKQARKHKSPIPVKGKLNGVWFRQSLVRYRGKWRLYINGQMAKKSKLPFTGSVTQIVGQTVEIAVMVDRSPIVYAMIPKLEVELNQNIGARENFDQLTAGRRKEIFRYLGSLKTEDSLDRNIHRVIAHLVGKETDRLYALMHRKKTCPSIENS